MAEAMGTDRDGLVNQALFMFARLNGFLESNGTGSTNGAGPATKPPLAAKSMGPMTPPSRAAVSGARADEDPGRREVAERVLETAAELERLIKSKNEARLESLPPPPPPENSLGVERPSDSAVSGGEANGLFLQSEAGELDRISKDRFVLGRGKHCDFVINSGKVSREHAVVVRDGNDWFVEDLGSSNGTWFNKQRIKRRKIEDGDEYYICSERVKFVLR